MTFSNFAQFLFDLEKTSSRLEMTALLADLFKLLSSQQSLEDYVPSNLDLALAKQQALSEVRSACYLMQGKLVPAYRSLEFALSVKSVIKVLARLQGGVGGSGDGDEAAAGSGGKSTTEKSPRSQTTSSVVATQQELLFANQDLFGAENLDIYIKNVTAQYKQKGDLGLVAEEIVGVYQCKGEKQPATSLAINQVYQALVKIAQDGGSGSQERKITALADLLKQVEPLSARYIVRIVVGKLRLGFSTMTILDALSWTVQQNKDLNKTLEEAYQKKADIGLLAEGFLAAKGKEDREKFLADYQVEIGVPVVPALCQRLDSYQEIAEKLGEMYAEPKYDGLRVQIHFKDGKASAFTRNLEDATAMFPELVFLAKQMKHNCILDSEAIGIDKKTQAFVPFQETITRKRKHGVDQAAQDLPIRFYVFDVLAIDDKVLINQPLSERKELLADLFKNNQFLEKTNYISTQDPEELKDFHEKQLKLGLEGAVIKKTDSLYRSGRKGWRWVKIKEEAGTRGKLKDTLDLIVMGYYFGRGKRTDFGLGAFLVGVLDKDEVKTVAKIGTGLSDKQLKELQSSAQEIKAEDKPAIYQVPKELAPDVWLKPTLVVEIAADEITKSPLHSAKFALRFPRLVKFRTDKSWEDATSLEELKQIS